MFDSILNSKILNYVSGHAPSAEIWFPRSIAFNRRAASIVHAWDPAGLTVVRGDSGDAYPVASCSEMPWPGDDSSAVLAWRQTDVGRPPTWNIGLRLEKELCIMILLLLVLLLLLLLLLLPTMYYLLPACYLLPANPILGLPVLVPLPVLSLVVVVVVAAVL